MAYMVVRTIKGRQYRYLQRSYRAGKKVKTVSEYLGPVGAILRAPRRFAKAVGELIEANRTTEPMIDEEAMLRDVTAKEAAHARMIERFEEETGLKMPARNPVPIEKQILVEAKIDTPAAAESEQATDAAAAPSPAS